MNYFSATRISAYLLINKLVVKPQMRNNRDVVNTIVTQYMLYCNICMLIVTQYMLQLNINQVFELKIEITHDKTSAATAADPDLVMECGISINLV